MWICTDTNEDLFFETGVCAEVSHHRSIPARLHFQEMQTSVRAGCGWPRDITWSTCNTHSIHHPCSSTTGSSNTGCCAAPTTTNTLWPTRRKGGQTDFSGVRLPELSQDFGVWGEDDYLGDHLLQGPWRCERTALTVFVLFLVAQLTLRPQLESFKTYGQCICATA